jgi:dolichol-phosphate mannosyltransferase
MVDPGTSAPDLTVIAPMRNESSNVLVLAECILRAFPNYSSRLEVILVDDASTDGTWEKILQAREADSRIRALRHAQPGGQSAALWTGFEASRGQIIATLDGDLQNDPGDLPRLINELAQCDLVCGVRARRMDSGLRRVSSAVARWFRKAALGVDFRDIGCNFRAFKRPVLQTLLPFEGLHRFLPVLVHDAGGKVNELDVAHHPRTGGRSKYGVWNRLGRGIGDLAMVAWYRKRQLKVVPVMEARQAPRH